MTSLLVSPYNRKAAKNTSIYSSFDEIPVIKDSDALDVHDTLICEFNGIGKQEYINSLDISGTLIMDFKGAKHLPNLLYIKLGNTPLYKTYLLSINLALAFGKQIVAEKVEYDNVRINHIYDHPLIDEIIKRVHNGDFLIRVPELNDINLDSFMSNHSKIIGYEQSKGMSEVYDIVASEKNIIDFVPTKEPEHTPGEIIAILDASLNSNTNSVLSFELASFTQTYATMLEDQISTLSLPASQDSSGSENKALLLDLLHRFESSMREANTFKQQNQHHEEKENKDLQDDVVSLLAKLTELERNNLCLIEIMNNLISDNSNMLPKEEVEKCSLLINTLCNSGQEDDFINHNTKHNNAFKMLNNVEQRIESIKTIISRLRESDGSL